MMHFLLLTVLGSLSLFSFADDVPDSLLEDEWDMEEESFEEGLESLPMVLTASRLKQPRSEVPASVTVIDAQQIKLWGARTIPELMKFVPGMFVGHADNENNASVTYHTSSPNIMRRLQVLIDGRSVYKSAIANVIWDDVPLAIEDIDRIEVTRGPNAALYGANSYLGVINILTKHPDDSLGTALSVRKGNKGVQDIYLRHGLSFDSTSVRISAAVKADEGFDGKESTGADALRDGRRHGFINAYINHEVDERNELDIQAAYKSGKTEIRKIDFDTVAPDAETQNGYLYGRWKHEFNENHQSHLQVYWQKEERKQGKEVCAPTLTLDPVMSQLYRQNGEWADILASLPALYSGSGDIQGVVAGLRAGGIPASNLEAIVEGFTGDPISITDQDLTLTQLALQNVPNLDDDFTQQTCGQTDTDLNEQRYDIEWQDTVRWNKDLRTVSGISYRQDSAYSKTYFNGEVNNDTWRAFMNAEYRLADIMTFNLGGMYEYETVNESAFSPRFATNLLLSPNQSLRFVASQAVRSPDLIESRPEFIFTVDNPTVNGERNYLNQEQADFYQSQIVDDEKDLTQEKITSYELGYFYSTRISESHLEFDVKIFHEEMRDMISDPITLQAKNISNDNEADVDGVEFQVNTKLNSQHSIWLTYSYIDVDNRYTGNNLNADEIIKAEKFERRLSSENSLVTSWLYHSQYWSTSLSYFYQDSRHINNHYERYQWNLITPFKFADIDFEASYFLQHNREPENPLNYSNQIYSTANIFYAQLAVEF